MFSKKWFMDMLDRVIKTFFQTVAILVIGETGMNGKGIFTVVNEEGEVLMEGVNWMLVLSGATLASVLSLCTSVGSSAVGDHSSASLLE